VFSLEVPYAFLLQLRCKGHLTLPDYIVTYLLQEVKVVGSVARAPGGSTGGVRNSIIAEHLALRFELLLQYGENRVRV